MKILNTEPKRFSALCSQELALLGDVDELNGARQELLRIIEKYDILVIALEHFIDKELLARATRLRFIVTPTTGLNHIDLTETDIRGIRVISLKNEVEFLRTVTATAELTWTLLLSVLRKLPSAVASVNDRVWNRKLFIGSELKGKTLGIIGYGRLGQMVEGYGNAFGMNVIAYDPYFKGECIIGKKVSLSSLLGGADVISIHVPLNDETHGFIDSVAFSKMKYGVVVINTSRGEVIEEKALLEGLKSGKVAMAGLDVMASEYGHGVHWMSNDKLIDYASTHDNLIITPHIGGATHESSEMTNRFIIAKLKSNLLV